MHIKFVSIDWIGAKEGKKNRKNEIKHESDIQVKPIKNISSTVKSNKRCITLDNTNINCIFAHNKMYT